MLSAKISCKNDSVSILLPQCCCVEHPSLIAGSQPHRSLPPRSVHLVNCSRDSYICAESLDAKLGSASLLAVVQSGQALLGEGRREEVIRRLAPSCLRGGAPQLDRASLVSALGLIKVN